MHQATPVGQGLLGRHGSIGDRDQPGRNDDRYAEHRLGVRLVPAWKGPACIGRLELRGRHPVFDACGIAERAAVEPPQSLVQDPVEPQGETPGPRAGGHRQDHAFVRGVGKRLDPGRVHSLPLHPRRIDDQIRCIQYDGLDGFADDDLDGFAPGKGGIREVRFQPEVVACRDHGPGKTDVAHARLGAR